MTKLLVNKIRTRWPEVKIIIRGDSGFGIEKLMRWCDKNDVYYVFGFAKNSVLIEEIAEEMARAETEYALTESKQVYFKWFRYRARKWHCHRWMIGKAEYNEKGSNPRFVVTNLPSDEGIIDTTYHRPRIDGKQIKQVKKLGTQCSVSQNPKPFTKRSTALEVRWKIGSRSSSCTCSLIARAVVDSLPINFDYCLPRSRTYSSTASEGWPSLQLSNLAGEWTPFDCVF